MTEWEGCTLGEAPIQIIDGDRGKNYPQKADFLDAGYCLFLNTKNVTSTGFVFSELNFISQDRDNLLRKGKLKRGDLVLTTRGTVGNVAYYDESVQYDHIRINSGMVIIRPDGINERFNYQLFKFLHSSFQVFATGSAQPQLPIRDLREIPIRLPPPKEQEAITAVLSSLDDKIDLLHRQNKTLESLAQTLFRHWFVVGADEDWEETELGEIASLSYGKFLPIKDLKGGPYPVFSGYSIVGYHDEYLYSEPQLIIVCRGVGGSGDIKISPPNCWITNLSIVIQPKQDWLSQNYLYWALETSDRSGLITGSVQAQVTINHLAVHAVAKPPLILLRKFDQITGPFNSKIAANKEQIATLEKLRNTLLPKLMSGEVRVRL